MRPFGCPITILNIIDHLGKFDGKANEGLFVWYSINSKAFRVFNSRTRIVEENLHVQFSENTPNIVRSGPNWLFDIDALTKLMNYKPVVAGNQSNGNACTKACDDAGKVRMETIPGKYYNLLPLWTADRVRINTTNNVNAFISTVNTAGIEVNVVGEKTSIELPDDPNMHALEEIIYSDDNEDVGAEADMNNLDTFMPVSPIPTTRVHKDHPVKQIIKDLNSAPQTRRMTKNLEEHGLFSLVHSYKDPRLQIQYVSLIRLKDTSLHIKLQKSCHCSGQLLRCKRTTVAHSRTILTSIKDENIGFSDVTHTARRPTYGNSNMFCSRIKMVKKLDASFIYQHNPMIGITLRTLTTSIKTPDIIIMQYGVNVKFEQGLLDPKTRSSLILNSGTAPRDTYRLSRDSIASDA
ncbi:hypothetical protein Tco_0257597 [Tanacetum coccineum]